MVKLNRIKKRMSAEEELTKILLEELNKQNGYFCDKIPIISDISTIMWCYCKQTDKDKLKINIDNDYDIEYVDSHSVLHLKGGKEEALDSYDIADLPIIKCLIMAEIEKIIN